MIVARIRHFFARLIITDIDISTAAFTGRSAHTMRRSRQKGSNA